jgi:hypothetical protein
MRSENPPLRETLRLSRNATAADLNSLIVDSGEGKTTFSLMRMPRQPGGRTQPEAAMGVSAFAFQGTNAHAVLQPGILRGDEPKGDAQAPAWRRQRFWYSVENRASLFRAVPIGGGQVGFQTVLSRASLAFFMDHRIQVGRSMLSLFPA